MEVRCALRWHHGSRADTFDTYSCRNNTKETESNRFELALAVHVRRILSCSCKRSPRFQGTDGAVLVTGRLSTNRESCTRVSRRFSLVLCERRAVLGSPPALTMSRSYLGADIDSRGWTRDTWQRRLTVSLPKTRKACGYRRHTAARESWCGNQIPSRPYRQRSRHRTRRRHRSRSST